MTQNTTDTSTRCEAGSDCISGKRNLFFRQKSMGAEEFRIEQSYFLERRRLINRSVHGWGVVAGYKLDGPRAPKTLPPSGAPDPWPPRSATAGPTSGVGAAPTPTTPHSTTPSSTRSAATSPPATLTGATIAPATMMRATALPATTTPPGVATTPTTAAGPPTVATMPGVATPTGATSTGVAPASTIPEVTIGPGLALDRHGRELLSCETVSLTDGNTFLVDPTNCGNLRPLKQAAPGRYVLRAHYAERRTGDVAIKAQCGCGQVEKTFVCETVVFSLEHLCCEESCPCEEADCSRHCTCGQNGCCSGGRGPHSCLCEWVANTSVDCTSRGLCAWRTYLIDPSDAVALACVTIERRDDPCQPVHVKCIDDDCSPRRLVKSNELLYDLARGCDLTYIEWISWAEWHRNPKAMTWHEFRTFIPKSAPLPEPNPSTGHRSHPRPTNFKVRFSGPVLADTVTPDCFALRFIFRHEDTGWYAKREVRLPLIQLSPPEPGDPLGTTREAQLVVGGGWYHEITHGSNKFHEEGATVNIEIYGDYILDCHGQPVDANANGFALAKNLPGSHSGNGTPGGAFLSVFRVERRHSHDEDDASTTP